MFFWCDFLLVLSALSLVGGQSVYGSCVVVGLSSPLSKSSFMFYFISFLVFLHPKSSIDERAILPEATAPTPPFCYSTTRAAKELRVELGEMRLNPRSFVKE